MAFLLPFIDTRKIIGNVQEVTEDSSTQGSETEIHEAEYNQTQPNESVLEKTSVGRNEDVSDHLEVIKKEKKTRWARHGCK